MPNTLLLDTLLWDLCVDSNGDIAMASEPYSLAQDAASYIKLFEGELWYDTTQGIPYFQQVLGTLPPLGLMKTLFQTAANEVPGVSSSTAFISNITELRVLTGQIQIISDATQQQLAAGFVLFPSFFEEE